MKILIGGDFVPQKRVANCFNKGDYETILSHLKAQTAKAGMSIVNLEAPIVESEQCRPIDKVGPNLKADISTIEALRYAGIDTVTLANNHIRDYGDWGISDTIFHLSRFGVSYVGAGLDLNESKSILYNHFGEITIAVINCCEHEFSIAGRAKAGANPINPIWQYYQIMEARQNADFIIIIVHGGVEYYNFPTPRMQDVYRFFVDTGADAVINHHQHCMSGYEYYHGRPIIYGTGNLCFDKGFTSHDAWNEGYLVELDLNSNTKTLSSKLIPFYQADNEPGIRFLKDDSLEMKAFQNHIKSINGIIADPVELREQYVSFLARTRRQYSDTVSPYIGKLNSLYVRHLLPGIMTKKKWLKLKNRVQCESHRERLLDMIESKTSEL